MSGNLSQLSTVFFSRTYISTVKLLIQAGSQIEAGSPIQAGVLVKPRLVLETVLGHLFQ